MLKIKNLKKRFIKTGQEDFLLNIPELSIENNEIVYVVGPNGSGKTVLLSIIQGQIDADEGYVHLDTNLSNEPIDILKIDPVERSTYLGFVPQESEEALINEMSVIDHVLVGLNRSVGIPWFFPRLQYSNRVKNILARFGLGFKDRLNELVGNLSTGERQVLSFCLAILKKPSLLLLDEFTAALDPEMAKKVLELVIKYIRENMLSSLIVTHRHKEAIENADRIIVLHKGKPFKMLYRNENDWSENLLENIFNQLYKI